MDNRLIFEQCIQFVSELEGRESELDLAKKMNVEVEDENLDLMVIQSLRRAVDHVQAQDPSADQSRVLYHVALYANAIRKPRFAISLCYIVINQPTSADVDREAAQVILSEIKLKLPEDIYNSELQTTTLDIQVALQDSQKWLKRQERHASQPPTKNVFNSDLIKKQSNKKAYK